MHSIREHVSDLTHVTTLIEFHVDFNTYFIWLNAFA